MAQSSIEWTESTWNPLTGCTKISPGCKHCYAERMAKRLRGMGQPRYANGFELTLHDDVLELPLTWRKPQRIFVNSMSDMFHSEVPEAFIQRAFDVMRRAHWHQFQVLTKRSDRLAELSPRIAWPKNVWMGVSVERQDYVSRIDDLRTKDRTRRYGSPGELAADIERSLRNEPVQAGPPGVVYRTRKFVRRHRVGVVVATTAVAGLVAFAITMSVQSARIAKERDRANREAQASKRVTDFLVGMFRTSDPGESQGQTITARQILDQGAERVGKDLSADPLVQARLMLTIGLVYQNLGLTKDAEPYLAKSLDVRRKLLGREHPDTLASMHALAELYFDAGRHPEAEKLVREAIEGRTRVLGEDNRDTLASLSLLGRLYCESGRPREAADLLEKKLDARIASLPADDPVALDVLITLTTSNLMRGRYPAAESQSRAALERELRRSPKENLFTLAARQRTALLCFLQGKYDVARSLYQVGLEVSSKLYGPDHGETRLFQDGLVATAFFLTNREEALAAQRRTLQRALRETGPISFFTAQQQFAVGMMNGMQGRFAEAEGYFRKSTDAFRELTGPVGYNTLWAQNGLATALLHNGKLEEAQKILEAVVAAAPEAIGPEHPHTRDAMRHLAEVYAAQQRDAEAEKLFEAALADVPPEAWQDPRVQSGALFGLAGLVAARGERAQALDHLRKAIALGFDDPAGFGNPRFDSLRSDPAFAGLTAGAEANSRRPPAAPTL